MFYATTYYYVYRIEVSVQLSIKTKRFILTRFTREKNI